MLGFQLLRAKSRDSAPPGSASKPLGSLGPVLSLVTECLKTLLVSSSHCYVDSINGNSLALDGVVHCSLFKTLNSREVLSVYLPKPFDKRFIIIEFINIEFFIVA